MTRHLLHIGYAKTATNFLRAWFAAHPQIAFAPGGFAGFYRLPEIAAPGTLDREAPRLRVSSSELLATPHAEVGRSVRYERDGGAFAADQARVCATLADIFPEAEVLIVTRGFRSMLLSSYSQYVRTGGANDLAAFAQAAAERGAWHYDRLIGLYERSFAPERVIVLPWELLRDCPEGFIRELEARLALNPGPVPQDHPNQALRPEELAAQLRLTRALQTLPIGSRGRRLLLGRYGRLAAADRLRGLLRLLNRAGANVPIDPAAADLQAFRGQAARLASRPLFAPYADDYHP